MVHWLWALITFIIGAIFGIFVIAFMEVSRREDNRPKKWWEE